MKIENSPTAASPITFDLPDKMSIHFPFTMCYKVNYDHTHTLYHVISPGSITSHVRPDSKNLHQHDHFELLYVLKGEVTNVIEQTSYVYKAGDACLLNRNTRHIDLKRDDSAAVFLNLSAEYIEDLIKDNTDKSENGKIHLFLTSNLEGDGRFARNYVEFTPSMQSCADGTIASVMQLIDVIQVELIEQKPGFGHLIKGLLQRLFSVLEDEKKYYSDFVHLDAGRQDFIYTRIINYLREKNGNVTRDSLSQALNYNAEYLNKIVKNRTGLSLMRLSRKFQLEKAKELLTNTERSITSIIEELGFVSGSHFYTAFRAETGKSPREYRRCQYTNVQKEIKENEKSKESGL